MTAYGRHEVCAYFSDSLYGYYGTTPRLHTVSNDQNGLNSSYSYQAGSTQDFRLTDISNYSSGTTVLSKFDYTYNPVGAIASWQEQADSSTPTIWNYGYDNADQLTTATRLNTSTSAVLSQYVEGYDPAGNRTSEQNNLSVTQTSVNNLNQMTGGSAGGPLQFAGSLSKPAKVTVAGQPATYGNYYSTNFSGIANVTSGTNSVPVVATDVNGNSATNNYQVVVPSGSSTSPTYDGDGNLTNNGNGQAYTWDARNELTAIVYSSGANSGNHTEFTYDGLGRRVSIVERTGTTIGSGTINSAKQFVWVASRIAEERDASGTTVTKRFLFQGEQITGTNYYFARDHLGSIREMTNNSGAIEARYDYDPYGRATKISGSMDSDFQYAGYYEHATSGLNLTLFRAYDPNSAKWLSRDPLGEGWDATLYSYVWNDPIILIDPLGLLSQAAWQYVSNALNSSDGNLSVANALLVVARQGDEQNVPLRDAQHFLYAASACNNGPLGPPAMMIGIPYFTTSKELRLQIGALSPLESAPSWEEMEAGYEGVGFGLGYTGDPPPLLPIVTGPGTAYPFLSPNVSPTASTGGASTGN